MGNEDMDKTERNECGILQSIRSKRKLGGGGGARGALNNIYIYIYKS